MACKVIAVGEILKILGNWRIEVCVDEEPRCSNCIAQVRVPRIVVERLSEDELTLLALLASAKATMDYRLVTAAHLYAVRNKLPTNRAYRLVDRVSVAVRLARATHTCWEAVFWRGIAYAQTLLDAEKPVVVKVNPPEDKREREKLRYLLEGARITRSGKTYHTGGLVKKLGGKKIAPWIYLVPRSRLHELMKHARVEIIT